MDDSPTFTGIAPDFVELTVEIVSAYVAKNNLPTSELPTVLHNVHAALSRLGSATEEPKIKSPVPAVPIRKSITDDYLISLENGQRFKSLKRHLKVSYNLTPEQYREKWGLPKDYPMVAPAYAASRSALARSLGLGRKAAAPPPPPPPAPTPPLVSVPVKKRRGKRSVVAEAA